jgi:hypothetical protein
MANFHLTGLPSNMMFAGLGLPLVPTDDTYKAVINPSEQISVVGSTLTFDGRASITPTGVPPLMYFWAFKEYPIGSQVDKYLFTSTEVDDSIVSFSPDVPGFYTIELIIGDNNFLSPPAFSEATITILMVPHNQGLVPDADFIWNYLGDFWNSYSDKDRWSTIWSSFIQITANELLASYQVDYNKSIKDIQDLFQKKWLGFHPRYDLTSADGSFILADDQAGLQASTSLLNMANQPPLSNTVNIPNTEGKFTTTSYNSPISINRVLRVKNSTYTLVRSNEVGNRSVFFGDRNIIQTGFSNLPWRFSSTYIDKNLDFEHLGVSAGDILVVDIAKLGTNLKANLSIQICAVDRNKLGFVFNTDSLVEGTPAGGISDLDQLYLGSSLGVKGLSQAIDGSLVYQDEALDIKTTINSIIFKRSYFEKTLNELAVINLGPFSIKIKPLYIIRNSKISINEQITSIPALQEYIKQPYLVRSGNTIGKAIEDTIHQSFNP